MRYLDELLRGYAGRDEAVRRFILAQVRDERPDHGSADLVRLLFQFQEMADPTASVAVGARHVPGFSGGRRRTPWACAR